MGFYFESLFSLWAWKVVSLSLNKIKIVGSLSISMITMEKIIEGKYDELVVISDKFAGVSFYNIMQLEFIYVFLAFPFRVM